MKMSGFKSMMQLVLYIIVITFISDKVMYYALNFVNDKILSGQSGGKLNHFLKVKDDVSVLTFGNSRTNHHINTQKLSLSSFNMGADSRSIAYCATLIKLLPKNKEQIVIVNVDTKNAFDDNYSGRDVGSLRSRYHRDAIVKKEIDKVFGYDYIQNFYWSKAYNGRVLGLFKNYLIPKYDYKKYYGYDPIYVTETQREIFKSFLKNPKKQKCLQSYTLNSRYKSYLNQIKNFCKENNKRLVLITSPLYDDTCKNDNLALIEVLKKLDFEYYDFSYSFKENNKIEYWKDEVHLSNVGAEMFSEVLKETIYK